MALSSGRVLLVRGLVVSPHRSTTGLTSRTFLCCDGTNDNRRWEGEGIVDGGEWSEGKFVSSCVPSRYEHSGVMGQQVFLQLATDRPTEQDRGVDSHAARGSLIVVFRFSLRESR